MAQGLRALGARVRAVEPYAEPHSTPSEVMLVEQTEAEVRAADAVVILTDHDVFDYAMLQDSAEYLFDTRNRCRGPRVERL